MSSSSNNKSNSRAGEWLFVSFTVSIAVVAIMWDRWGALWGIATFLLCMAVCLIRYYRIKRNQDQEDQDV